MTDRANLSATVHHAVSTAVQEAAPGTFVTKAVVIYEAMDNEGKLKLHVWPSEGARWWDVMGMCKYAVSVADAVIAQQAAGNNL